MPKLCLPISLYVAGSRVCTFNRLVHTLSVHRLTHVSTPGLRCTVWPRTNALEISKQIGASKVLCEGSIDLWTRRDAHYFNPQIWTNNTRQITLISLNCQSISKGLKRNIQTVRCQHCHFSATPAAELVPSVPLYIYFSTAAVRFRRLGNS